MKNIIWVLILVVGCGSKNSDSSSSFKDSVKAGTYKLTTKDFTIQAPATHTNCKVTGDMQYKVEWQSGSTALVTLSGSSKYTCDNGLTDSVGCKTGTTVGVVTFDSTGLQTSNTVQTDTCVNSASTVSTSSSPSLTKKWTATTDGIAIEMSVQNAGTTGTIKDTFIAQ